MNYRIIQSGDHIQIASIHKIAFDDFFLSSFGLSFLQTYYQACLKEDSSIAVCAVDENGDIKGFATGSIKSAGYHKRLFVKNLIPFLWAVSKSFIKNPFAIYRLAKNMDKKPVKNDNQDYAELLSIAVLPEQKGTGTAKELLGYFEQELKKRGASRVALTTDFNNNDRVIAFYRKSGYEIYYDFYTYPNRHMYKMIKTL